MDFDAKGIGPGQRERVFCEVHWVRVAASETCAIVNFERGAAMRLRVLVAEIT